MRMASALVFLLAWQIAASIAGGRMLPTVTSVLGAMLQQTMTGALPWNLAITLGRVAAAFTLSMLLGSALGIAMGRWRRLDLLLDNAVTVLLNLPALVVIVLLYVWFGLNEFAAIAAVALNKFPTTVVTLREGARARWIRHSLKWPSFHMSRRRTLRHIILPSSRHISSPHPVRPRADLEDRAGRGTAWPQQWRRLQVEIFFQLFDVKLILAYTFAFILIVQMIEWVVLQPMERRATRWRADPAAARRANPSSPIAAHCRCWAGSISPRCAK